MRGYKAILAGILAVAVSVTGIPVWPVLAEETETESYMFDSADKAYATDMEYMEELGLYVVGGKGFYTSPDGIHWTARAAELPGMQDEIYGFAYGGPRKGEYFLVLLDSASEEAANKAILLNKTMTEVTEVYTYTTSGEDVRLKGVVEWDDYTGKFWCGAALADGTGAGLYYSDGTYGWDADEQRNKMLWTKADTGECALIDEDTAYPNTVMTTVISSITSDEKGHIVAFGMWADKLKNGDRYSTLKNGSGGLTCQTALLVDADGTKVEVQLCDFSKFSTSSGLSTAVIDKKSNVIIQDTSTYKLLTFYGGSFDELWALGNHGQATVYSSSSKTGVMKSIKYAVNPNASQLSNCIHTNNMTNALSRIVCFEDKVLLIPRSGQGVGGNNYLSDIFVVTYNGDGTLKSRFLPFINNEDTARSLLGDYVNDGAPKYIADAVAGPDNTAVLIAGKHEKEITEEQDYGTVIAVIATGDTVTDSTLSNEETAIPDRTERITFAESEVLTDQGAIVLPQGLDVTGPNIAGHEDWLKNYQADTLVGGILNGNIAFLHDSNRVWVEDSVVIMPGKAEYISEEKEFVLPVEAVNQLFGLNESSETGMISSGQVEALTGKATFIDPRGFLLFSDKEVVDTSVPNGYSSYRDYYTVADAMGYISWEDRTFTEEERNAYIRRWRSALSVPENGDYDAGDMIGEARKRLGEIEIDEDGTYRFSGITLDGYNLTGTELRTFKENLHEAYKKLLVIATGYACMDKEDDEAKRMKEVILGGINYLLPYYSQKWDYSEDSKQNWTLSQFSLPITCSNLLCLMYEDMDTVEGRRLRNQTCDQIFDKAPIPNLRTAGKQNQSETYTNRLWKCFSYFNTAVIAGDDYRMNYAMKYATAAFLYSPRNTGFEELQYNKDGFYEDGSMVFHGSVPYNMGYGVSYSVLIYEFLMLTSDTKFDIRGIYGFDNVYDFCLKNFLPFLTNGMMNKMVVGRGNVLSDTAMLRNVAYIANYAPEGKRREITMRIQEILDGRKLSAGALQYIVNKPTLQNMLAEYEAYAQTLPESTGRENESTVYYNQDQVIHRREDFTAALSMSSERTAKYESYKTTNGSGWYLGDGMLYVYMDDKQYTQGYFDNINPYYMPGTTVDSTRREIIHTETDPDWGLPENDWAGGVTDGENTVAGYQLGNQYVSGLAGKKSYFLFGDKIICMGSGITGGEGEVYTVLDNRMINKPISDDLEAISYEVHGITTDNPDKAELVYKLIDGDITTNCQLNAYDNWMVFDLGEKVNIGLVGMAFFMGDARSELATIQISDDGVNYTDLTEFASTGQSKDMELYEMNCSCRYFKIISHGNSRGNQWFNMTEIAFYKEGLTKEQVEASRDRITEGYDELVIDGVVQTPEFNDAKLVQKPEWLWLEGQEGFVFLEDTSLNVMREKNGAAPVYMRMSIEHGEQPQDAGYAYVQLPKATLEETAAFAENGGIEILERSTRAHVVFDRDSGIIGANIFEPGVVVEGITFHTPCAVLIDKEAGKIYISEPTWKQDQVSFTLPENIVSVEGSDVIADGNKILLKTNVRRGASHEISYEVKKEDAPPSEDTKPGDENQGGSEKPGNTPSTGQTPAGQTPDDGTSVRQSPKTGDVSPVWLWGILAALSAGAFTAGCIGRRQKRGRQAVRNRKKHGI